MSLKSSPYDIQYYSPLNSSERTNKTVFSSQRRYLHHINALTEIKQSCVVGIFRKRQINLTLNCNANPRCNVKYAHATYELDASSSSLVRQM